jgi:hypothetical protein
MHRWRRSVGTLLLWTPFAIFIFFILFGVLLGSMGIDIHWTSKKSPYIVAICLVMFLGACLAVGRKLRKSAETARR